MKAKAALDLFVSKCKESKVKRILDIGSGQGRHAKFMRDQGLAVETNDILQSDHQMPYDELIDLKGFDGIWCSHVLEHQINPGMFLKKIHNDLHEGGILAITVPPRKDEIVGGHVTLWNAGLLLYNLVMAGFDCSDASVATYHYNISVVLKKKSIELPELYFDNGDIDKLSKFFPKGLGAKEGFNGLIRSHNWPNVKLDSPIFFKQIQQ